MARRKIYDNGGTSVYETVNTNDNANIKKDFAKSHSGSDAPKHSISGVDAISAFAGYLIPQINFMENGVGNCLICGIQTNSPTRTLCLECMRANKEKMFELLKKQIGEANIEV